MLQRLIDQEYFKNYAGSGKHYNTVWSQHSYAAEFIQLVKKQRKDPKAQIKIKKIIVLGTATGKILAKIDKDLGIKASGCEINSWAHSQIPAPYKRKIKCQDMRLYIQNCLDNEKTFDMAFTNSLIYLKKNEILGFLKKLSQISKFVHFNSSFAGHACPDEYRCTLEPFAWWQEVFSKAGFEEFKIPKLRRSYVWKSKNI